MKNYIKTIIILFLITVSLSAQNKKPLRLVPVDESRKDRSLVKFKNDVLKAIDKKDTSFIISVLDTNILNSFGGNGGIQELRQMWQIENPNSSLWVELKKVFSMGGTFFGVHNHMFVLPYIFGNWPEDYDPFGYVAVIKKNIYLRDSPTVKSKVIKKLSYDILEILESGVEKGKWSKVMTADSLAGYVYSDFVRSPLDYRAILKKENGKWKIISFVSGD